MLFYMKAQEKFRKKKQGSPEQTLMYMNTAIVWSFVFIW